VARATRLVARQSAGSQRRGRWQLEEDRMDDIRLPRHVIDRLEHRWDNRNDLSQIFRVHARRERSRADEIGEHHSYLASLRIMPSI
jgi:hypothetical protein